MSDSREAPVATIIAQTKDNFIVKQPSILKHSEAINCTWKEMEG